MSVRAHVCVSMNIFYYHCNFPGPVDSATVRLQSSETFHSKSKDYKALKGACILCLSHLSFPRLCDCFQIFFTGFHFLSLLNIFC